MSETTDLQTPEARPISMKRQMANDWALAMMAHRLHSAPLEHTELHCARIRGFKRFAATADNSAEAEAALVQQLYSYAYQILVSGGELPVVETTPLEMPHHVAGIVRLNRLRDLLRLRAKDWGLDVKNVPSQAIVKLLHSFDAAITRQAMQLR